MKVKKKKRKAKGRGRSALRKGTTSEYDGATVYDEMSYATNTMHEMQQNAEFVGSLIDETVKLQTVKRTFEGNLPILETLKIADYDS